MSHDPMPHRTPSAILGTSSEAGPGDEVVAQPLHLQPGRRGQEGLDVVGYGLFVEADRRDGHQRSGQLKKVDGLWIRNSRLLDRFN
jgi:hypothetical protein